MFSAGYYEGDRTGRRVRGNEEGKKGTWLRNVCVRIKGHENGRLPEEVAVGVGRGKGGGGACRGVW